MPTTKRGDVKALLPPGPDRQGLQLWDYLNEFGDDVRIRHGDQGFGIAGTVLVRGGSGGVFGPEGLRFRTTIFCTRPPTARELARRDS